MQNFENLELRILMRKSGVLHRDVAKALGLSASRFSQILSKPVTRVFQRKVLIAIDLVSDKEGTKR